MKWELLVRLALKGYMMHQLFKRVRKGYDRTRLDSPERLKYLITGFPNKMPDMGSL